MNDWKSDFNKNKYLYVFVFTFGLCIAFLVRDKFFFGINVFGLEWLIITWLATKYERISKIGIKNNNIMR